MVPCAPRTDPRAHRDRRDRDRAADVLGEPGEAGADPDDVGDRVERAHLVEGDVERVGAVHARLGDGQPLEGAGGPVADVLVELGPLEQGPDVAPAAVVLRVGDLDVAAGGGEAVAGDRLGGERDRLGGDRVDGPPSTSRGTPAPRRAPSSMSPLAPADASTQTVIARSRSRASAACAPTRRAMRAAATPAPYPLSMLTTVTPGAQELSMPSSAARPPKEAP